MDAVDAVLDHNLHGLEIDPRCVEIAVFALALAAWRYPDENGNPSMFTNHFGLVSDFLSECFTQLREHVHLS